MFQLPRIIIIIIASYLHLCLLSSPSPTHVHHHNLETISFEGEKRVPSDEEDVHIPGGLRHLRLQDQAGVHKDEQHLGEGGSGGG